MWVILKLQNSDSKCCKHSRQAKHEESQMRSQLFLTHRSQDLNPTLHTRADDFAT
uniref:Uncharacterized protein n=1 Tax=Arundo donax TaxID=35708 RepID=A0A0A8Z175_ARUDO